MLKQKSKLIIFFLVFLLSGILFAGAVFAQDPTLGATAVGEAAGLQAGDPRVIVGNIIRVILGLLGTVAIVLVLYGGFLYMTAGGDNTKVEKAKKYLINAGIGTAIIILSFAITTFIVSGLQTAVGGGGGVAGGGDGAPDVGGLQVANVRDFTVQTLTPNGVFASRKLVVTATFNRDIDQGTITADTFKVTDNNGALVGGSIVPSARKAVFTPSQNCPAPNDNYKCFNANSDYKVTLVPGAVKAKDGRGLSCAGEKCTAAFTTGDQVDVDGPVADFITPLSGDRVPVDNVVPVTISAEDGSGVSSIAFYEGDNLIDESGAAGNKKEQSNFDWVTDGVALGRHTLKATATDVSGETGEKTISVKVLPAECFDAQGEPVCGNEACGACEGGACNSDEDCLSGMYCGGDNKCVALPTIKDVVPKEASRGSFVTIFGSGFKTLLQGTSKIYFTSGRDANDQPVYVEAGLGCAADIGWGVNQVIAIVPATAVDGPIKIVNRDNKYDTTDNDRGWKDDFLVNANLVTPGLCTVRTEGCVCADAACANCESGTIRQAVRAAGQNLGADRAAGFSLYFGRAEASLGAGSVWNDNQITNVQVPNLNSALVPVVVSHGERCLDAENAVCVKGSEGCVCSNIFSNPVNFRINELVNLPKINSVSPATGPVGQLITITGANFGNTVGRVQFVKPDGTRVPAALGCENGKWLDTQVVVAVPEGLEAAPHKIILTTSDNITSENFDFTVTAGTAGPSICSLDPDNGPPGTLVAVSGKNLGNKDTYKLRFGKDGGANDPGEEATAIGNWAATLIKDARVPAAAKTGGVFIAGQNGAAVSNRVDFRVGACSANSCGADRTCCKDGVCRESCPADDQAKKSEFAWVVSTGPLPKIPQILERACVVGHLSQSPSPARGKRDACPNAMISGTFNVLLKDGSLNNNLAIRRCVNPAGTMRCENDTTKACSNACTCVDVGECDLDTCEAGKCVEVVLADINALDIGRSRTEAICLKAGESCRAGTEGCNCVVGGDEITEFHLSSATLATQAAIFTNNELLGNYWYAVKVIGGAAGVKSVTDESMPADYIWKFKTAAAPCRADALFMSPALGVIQSVDKNESMQVAGQAQCESLVLSNYNWTWTSRDLAPIGGKARATFVSYGQVNGSERKDIGVYGVNPDFKANPPAALQTTGVNYVKAVASASLPRANSGLSGSVSKEGDWQILFADPKVVKQYPDCQDACVNAQIGATFNVKMKAETFTTGSVNLYKCPAGAECPIVSQNKIALTAEKIVYNYAEDAFSQAVTNNLSIGLAANLLPNTFYRVVLTNGVTSSSGVNLTGLNFATSGNTNNSYSWVFKTKNSDRECELDKVSVLPATYISMTKGEKIAYAAAPRTAPDACNAEGQVLDPYAFSWDWNSTNLNVATISETVFQSGLPEYCTENCLSRGSTSYAAVCGNSKVEYGEECDDGNLLNDDRCTDKCLYAPIVAPNVCKSGAECCGNGRRETFRKNAANQSCQTGTPGCVTYFEECDPGIICRDADDKDCEIGSAGCVCKSRDSSCSTGCQKTGTALGYTCGNGIIEPGEDVDDSNNRNGDGVSSVCILEGAPYKTTDNKVICGDTVKQGGEECEATCKKVCPAGTPGCANGAVCEYGSLYCQCTRPAYCSSVCLVTGTSACGLGKLTGCCGNGTFNNGNPNGLDPGEECEAVCVKEGCAAGEANCVDGADCKLGDPKCKCTRPATCSDKCLNIGSNPERGTSCRNGIAEPGEDPVCDAGGGAATGQSPYQLATVTGTITAMYNPALGYAEEKTAIEAKATKDARVRLGTGDLAYRSTQCSLANPVRLEQAVPAHMSRNACRNAMLYIQFNQQINYSNLQADPNALKVMYWSNEACPGVATNMTGWDKFKYYVKNILANPVFAQGRFLCDLPVQSVVFSETPDKKTGITITPRGLLPASTTVMTQIGRVIDMCGVPMAANSVYQFQFDTGSEVCRLDSVTMKPDNHLAVLPNQEQSFTATATSKGQLINSVPGVYSWNWVWTTPDNTLVTDISKTVNNVKTTIVNVAQPAEQRNVTVRTGDKNGKTRVSASAVISNDAIWRELGLAQNKIREVCTKADGSSCAKNTAGCNCRNVNEYDTTGSAITGETPVEVAICENRWDPNAFDNAKWELLQFTSGNISVNTFLREKDLNVGLFYCRDFGDNTTMQDDLPKLKETKVIEPLPNKFAIKIGDSDKLSYENSAAVRARADLKFAMSPVTFEAWVKMGEIPDDSPRFLYSKYNSCENQDCASHVSLYLKKAPDGGMFVGISGKRGNVSASYITVNKVNAGYNHIAYVWSGVSDQVRIYINGRAQVLQQTDLLSTNRLGLNRTDDIYLGSSAFASSIGKSLGGYLDEVAIWKTARTAAEIESDMSTRINPQDANLVLYVDFENSVANKTVVSPVTEICNGQDNCLNGKFKFSNLSTEFLADLRLRENVLTQSGANQCADNVDNDRNGLVDAADPKCQNPDGSFNASDKFEEPKMLAQYFFNMQDSVLPDVISLRVYENPEGLPPELWYQSYVPNPAESTTPMDVDCHSDAYGVYCYKAAKDETSVYISAANINNRNIYGNIYLIGYSRNADPKTVNIFSQLVNNIRFNMNGNGLSDPSKAQIIRDTKRVSDMVVLRKNLDIAQRAAGKYPQVAAGSYIRGEALSIWPSWENSFGSELQSAPPKDPQNHLKWELAASSSDYRGAECGGTMPGTTENKCLNADYQCVQPMMCVHCPEGYDKNTCYNPSTQTFFSTVLQDGTKHPMYIYNGSMQGIRSCYDFRFNLETSTGGNIFKVVPDFPNSIGNKCK